MHRLIMVIRRLIDLVRVHVLVVMFHSDRQLDVFIHRLVLHIVWKCFMSDVQLSTRTDAVVHHVNIFQANRCRIVIAPVAVMVNNFLIQLILVHLPKLVSLVVWLIFRKCV